MKENEAQELLEIVEARNSRGSVVVCSQFMPKGWLANLGQTAIAETLTPTFGT